MKKLLKVRKEAGLSQRQLGNLVGISRARYGHYETGARGLPVNIAKKIGRVLKINWWELY